MSAVADKGLFALCIILQSSYSVAWILRADHRLWTTIEFTACTQLSLVETYSHHPENILLYQSSKYQHQDIHHKYSYIEYATAVYPLL